MRQIVIGPVTKSQGISSFNVWFRFQTPAGNAARIAYYAKRNASFQPSAPGDYAAADQSEVTLFQNGTWVEVAGFVDVVDPTTTTAQKQVRLQNIYAAALTQWQADDTALLSGWASGWDGTTWTMKSA